MGNGFKLANRVRELRRRLKLRQADLAAEVDVTRQTIIAIEKGKLNPSIFICLKIARVLREPVDYVFFLDRADLTVDEAPARKGPPVVESPPVPEPPAVEEPDAFAADPEPSSVEEPAAATPELEPQVAETLSEPEPAPEPEPALESAPAPQPEPEREFARESESAHEPEAEPVVFEKQPESGPVEIPQYETVFADSGYDAPDRETPDAVAPTVDEPSTETGAEQPEEAPSVPDAGIVEEPESDKTSQTVWDF